MCGIYTSLSPKPSNQFRRDFTYHYTKNRKSSTSEPTSLNQKLNHTHLRCFLGFREVIAAHLKNGRLLANIVCVGCPSRCTSKIPILFVCECKMSSGEILLGYHSQITHYHLSPLGVVPLSYTWPCSNGHPDCV